MNFTDLLIVLLCSVTCVYVVGIICTFTSIYEDFGFGPFCLIASFSNGLSLPFASGLCPSLSAYHLFSVLPTWFSCNLCFSFGKEILCFLPKTYRRVTRQTSAFTSFVVWTIQTLYILMPFDLLSRAFRCRCQIPRIPEAFCSHRVIIRNNPWRHNPRQYLRQQTTYLFKGICTKIYGLSTT